MLIDFSKCERRNKAYGGVNGSKIAVVYNEELYMLKFPAVPTKNDELSYTNSCVSEYIGCKVFEHLEIPVQKVVLGTYQIGEKTKYVVGCKDFATDGFVIQDFASLKNQIIDSEHHGKGTELCSVIDTIEKQQVMDALKLEEHFWNMFIVDALIGNWDRHNGNWGFLYNPNTDEVKLAPVYDCGSCLYPQADENIIRNVLTDRSQMNHRIYNIPTSALQIDGKRINYFNFISSLKYDGCNAAIRRIVPKINLEQINQIIEDIPFITNLQKDFYKRMLEMRKDLILDFSYNKLLSLEYEKQIETYYGKNNVEKPREPKL